MSLNKNIFEKKINISWNSNAVGDTACFLPILKVLNDRGLIESVILPEKLIYLKDLIGLIVEDRRILIPKLDQIRYKSEYPFIKSFIVFPSSIHTHLVDYASIALSDSILPPKYRTMPILGKDIDFIENISHFNLPNRYVVICCGYTSILKKMTHSCFIELINFFNKNKIAVVLLGKSYSIKIKDDSFTTIDPKEYSTLIGDGNVINLIDKTTIRQTIEIIRKSECLVGMDSGLPHVAGLTEVPMVVAYTHKDPYYLMPIRHEQLGWNVFPVVPDEGICRFCMTEYFNPIGYDYTKCAKGNTECCSNITADKFIKQIKKIIKK